ncbi:MAG TPA: NAD-dependent epimerase/dehydratase family protein [Candidatus Ozemobacteraceae bacterium]|nr:NAD-dependent epimerase/dehydratase family protein [Candidatus Ozemobacteraceae bacterium]
MKILITGASGFVGTELLRFWRSSGHEITGTSHVTPFPMADCTRVSVDPRQRHVETGQKESSISWLLVDDLVSTDWDKIVVGHDVVVHLAARVHQMNDGPDAARLYFQTNTEGTRRLAESAQKAGVKRFVFISTVKAMGEETSDGATWTEDTPCQPLDAYGESKRAAEQLLLEMHRQSGFPAVILRPPLMYGPGVKGNMASLMHLVESGWPVPVGGIANRRSFLSVSNLASAIDAVIDHAAAVGQVFLVTDGIPMSTAQLVAVMGDAIGRKPWIIGFPEIIWRLGAKLPFLGSRVRRLTGSLALSSVRISTEIGWKPPFSMLDTLRETFSARQKN